MIGADKKSKMALIKKCLIFLAAVLVFYSANAYAQDPEITNGLNWLKNNQKTDGSWGNINNFRDTSTVINSHRSLHY